MTKDQAEQIIKVADAKFRHLQTRATILEREAYQARESEKKQAVNVIDARLDAKYLPLCKIARARRDAALNAMTALKIKYAGPLCGIPADSVMVEWLQDWNGWSETKRTGRLEIFLDGSEWAEDYGRPAIGTVVIRITGKNGRPTKQACHLTRDARGATFRKYVWLPKGERPKK